MIEQLNYDLTRISGVDWHGNPIFQQEQFVFAPDPHIGYFGGFNNGKTWSLCLRAIYQSLYHPNNKGLLCRSTVPELRRTTRDQFFQIFGRNESTIGKHPYVERWSSQENLLRFKNGSEVIFQHLSDEKALEGLLSFDGNWFAIDQAEEVPESAYLTLLSRIGRVDNNIPVWDAIAGNPAGHEWIWKRWMKNRAEAEAKGIRMIEATTFDNSFRREGYIETLMDAYDNTWTKRFIYGNWDSFAGQVYDDFDAKVHVIPSFDVPEEWKAGIGIDLGFNHPTAVIWVAIDYDGNHHIYQEHVAREMITEQHVNAMRMMGIYREDGKQLPIYAPHDVMNRSGQTGMNLQQDYARHGVYLQKGNQMNPMVRIQRIKKLLKIRDGRHPYIDGVNRTSKIFIHDCCPHIADEFGLYRWKELKPGQENERPAPDEVVKVNDDALDALGYFECGWASEHQPQPKIEKTVNQIDLEAFIAGENASSRDWKYN